MYNENTFKPVSPRSAVDAEQEDEAVERVLRKSNSACYGILTCYGILIHRDAYLEDSSQHYSYTAQNHLYHTGYSGECMYNEDTLKPTSPRSAADAEQEDAAMEESEEEPAQILNLLVTSDTEISMQVFDDARREDHASCSCHLSQFQQASLSNADETKPPKKARSLRNI